MSQEVMQSTVVPVIYLLSTILFIFGIKRLSKVKTARRGNALAAVGMLLAIIGALLELGVVDYRWIAGGMVIGTIIGLLFAIRVQMTSMPEMVALFNGFGGIASALVATSIYWDLVVQRGATGTVYETLGTDEAITVMLSILIGGITFTGSLIALFKLQGKLKNGQPILLPARHYITFGLLLASFAFGGIAVAAAAPDSIVWVLSLAAVSLILGILLTIPIGGADMPVVVSLLNSYSGVAASMAGFVIGNPLLIIAGAMVGAAGLILTQIMCVAMNRSLLNVLVGGFGVTDGGGGGGSDEYTSVTSCGPEEAAMLLENAESVIIIPGYGLAVAQAQHAVRELADLLKERGTKVTYGIHPVAGRMPGHMNVLLAEADVPYEELLEMDVINSEFKNTDVVIILGANDVVNPAATKDPSSPIAGMPILNAHEARSVFVVKRSLSPGYAGIKNELFEYDNT
ncbi:MAG: NAD(P)(+) transhydrogenase (Re/Si-specific) subunit beta, partial [Deltaproteobacteria bacterium]|nr:NAD(P)(+) transhydrogenase (Re/Si-specific) subunit beta [Deltaproteobacteria bacterium]MBW2376002.1 NAD(P)(+) transhydrogenase (Re/Si-specific) subunit beta [Deltaproteobacteria bacterium]